MSVAEALQRIEAAKKPPAEDLDLSGLDLSEVPSEIIDLASHLLRLKLGRNRLTDFPVPVNELEKLTHLSALMDLDVASNALKTLPAELAQCKNLTRVDLSGNQLSTVPGALATAVLHLDSNPLTVTSLALLPWKHLVTLGLSTDQGPTLTPWLEAVLAGSVTTGKSDAALPAELTPLTLLRTLVLRRRGAAAMAEAPPPVKTTLTWTIEVGPHPLVTLRRTQP